MRPNSRLVQPKYLLLALSSHEVRKQIEAKAKSTSGVNNINAEELKSLVIPVTNMDEHRAIVELLDQQLSVVDKQLSEIDTQLVMTTSLKQSILKKAFSGQLVPQDPNNEPAGILLERIA